MLPEAGGGDSNVGLPRRAALASTLLAGLELERGSGAALAQDGSFATVRIAPTPS